MTITYQITFFSYWAIGSGKTGGYGKDSIVLKDKNKLPFIPGKTLKGLLRDGAHESGMLDIDIIDLFGHENKKDEEKKKPQTGNSKGCLIVNSAYVEENVAKYLQQNTNLIAGLYETKTSTALDENKQAKNHSLHKIEVCIPLKLEATIENVLDKIKIEKTITMVRHLGEKRYRGLGRCKLKIIKAV